MTKNKRKSRKQRRLLLTSLMLALIIVIGGTFAWYTSKDEVTNQLTAKGNFGVDIWEDFTPTETWSETETINKDVKLVNTGNTDAYVKVTLTSKNTALSAYGTEKLGTTTNAVEITDDNERQAMQAGGKLVCVAGKAQTETDIDSDAYKPTTTGLYVFKRTTSTEAEDTTLEHGEFAGYYYDSTSGKYYRVTKIAYDSEKGYSASMVTKADVEDMEFTWNYDGLTLGNDIVLTYDPDSSTTGDEVKITITLVDGWEDNFDLVDISNAKAFYYKKVLAGGTTSEQLVDSVTLTKFPKDKYAQLDFDLNVIADAAQVVYSDDANKNLKFSTTTESWGVTGSSEEYTKKDTIAWEAYSK